MKREIYRRKGRKIHVSEIGERGDRQREREIERGVVGVRVGE